MLAFAKAEGIGINLEIKNYPTDDEDYDPTPAFANRIMDVVLESGIPAKQVIIQSFTPANLDVAESRMPDAEFALLSLAGPNDFGARRSPPRTAGTGSRRRGRSTRRTSIGRTDRTCRVVPYTLNQKADVEAAGEAGVDALITDDPLMALQTLDTEPAKRQARAALDEAREGQAEGQAARARLIGRAGHRGADRAAQAQGARAPAPSRSTRPARSGWSIRLTARGQAGARRTGTRAKVKLVAKTRDVALNRGTARATAPLG